MASLVTSLTITCHDCSDQGENNSTTSPMTTIAVQDTSSALDHSVFIRLYLGWRYRHIGESVTLTIVYMVIMVTGLIGNVSTCIVIGRNRAMHTPTNYYLFSLAVSDVLTLCLGLPPELYAIWEAYPWRFGEPYCLFKTFLTEVTSTASVLTISGFTVERYLAIHYPLRAQTASGLRRATRTVIVIWLIASIASIPYPLNTRTFHYVIDPLTGDPLADSYVCNIPSEWMPHMKVVFLVYSIVLFVVPMIVIVCLYTSIGFTLRRRSQFEAAATVLGMEPGRASVALRALGNAEVEAVRWRREVERGLWRRRRQHKTISLFYSCRQAVLKVLVAVVVTFFVCWAPFHAQRILTSCVRDNQWTPGLIELQHGLFYGSGVLYYVSSTVNPILYNVMSRKFRALFRRTLCGVNGNNTSRYPRLQCCCLPAPVITFNCNTWRPHQACQQPPRGGVRQSPGLAQEGHRIVAASHASVILLQQVPGNRPCLAEPMSSGHGGKSNLVQSAVNSEKARTGNHLLEGRRSSSRDGTLQEYHHQTSICRSEMGADGSNETALRRSDRTSVTRSALSSSRYHHNPRDPLTHPSPDADIRKPSVSLCITDLQDQARSCRLEYRHQHADNVTVDAADLADVAVDFDRDIVSSSASALAAYIREEILL